MRPIVTPAEMRIIDAEATDGLDVLIARAGWALAQSAIGLLPRTYGARVLVIAGKGNNGADGRVAAELLAKRGVRCQVVSPAESLLLGPIVSPPATGGFDLVIDASYGTGLRGTNVAPEVRSVPVLAVDIPSGVDGDTGAVRGAALNAVRTVTFAAIKPGLLFEPGASLAGQISVADIGLDCSAARAWQLEPADVADLWPEPDATTHKWRRAVWVIGGSPGLDGAPGLCAAAAARAGAGYVAVSLPGDERPGSTGPSGLPIETVRRAVGTSWSQEVVEGAERFAALVIGPGLAVDDHTGAEVRSVVARAPDKAMVLDAGAIDAVAADPSVLLARTNSVVLTPHDGEFARLTGEPVGADRIGAARSAAARFRSVVVLKGPATVIAEPDGKVFVSTSGDQRLASAGTGDVLAGLIGAALAAGLSPFPAAGLGVELHGHAASAGLRRGFIASDLPALVARTLSATGRPDSHGRGMSGA